MWVVMQILNQDSKVSVALRAPRSYREESSRKRGKPGIDTGHGRDGKGKNWREEIERKRDIPSANALWCHLHPRDRLPSTRA